MKITRKWLTDRNACKDGIEWVVENDLVGLDDVEFAQKLIDGKRFDWAIWLILRRLKRKDVLRCSAFCARAALPVWEKQYPDDDRPRKAIEAAERCIESNTKPNRDAADSAALAAGSAAVWAADIASAGNADSAVWAAARAASATARAAASAGWVDSAAAYRRYAEYALELLRAEGLREGAGGGEG